MDHALSCDDIDSKSLKVATKNLVNSKVVGRKQLSDDRANVFKRHLKNEQEDEQDDDDYYEEEEEEEEKK